MDKRGRSKQKGLYNNAIKIIRTKRKKKGGKSVGYNSQWVIYCTKCGSIITDKWDSDYYNCPCPCCKNEGTEITRTKEQLLHDMAKDLNVLYFSRRKKNVITSKENYLLTQFRETRFKSELDSLIQDFWFKPHSKYIIQHTEEQCVDNRGLSLLKNETFLHMLKLCYDLAYGRYI